MKKSAVKFGRKPLDGSRKAAKPANGALADWIKQYAADPQEVRAFCTRHRLLEAGRATLELAQEVYKPLAIRASVMGDPEGSSEWLILDVDLQSTVAAALRANDSFTEQWIDLLPVSKRLLIRVPYNFV